MSNGYVERLEKAARSMFPEERVESFLLMLDGERTRDGVDVGLVTAWTFEVLDWLKGLRTAPARRKPTPVADAAEGPDTHLLGTWQVRVYVVERPQSPVIVATVRGHRQEAQAYVYPILKEGLVVHHPSGQATHYPATSVERIEVERIDPNKAEAGEW